MWRNRADVLSFSHSCRSGRWRSWWGSVLQADAAGAEMHDKLTIPTSLTLNEASGCWADNITSWFSFIVWQDVVLFVLEVTGDCFDTRRFAAHENHIYFSAVKLHPGLIGALAATGFSDISWTITAGWHIRPAVERWSESHSALTCHRVWDDVHLQTSSSIR